MQISWVTTAPIEPAVESQALISGGVVQGTITTALPASLFITYLLQNTREGFFSDPIHGGNKGMVGWTLINFPGARADFMDWVERGERYPFPPVSINGERA